MRKYDYSFLKNDISSSYLNLAAIIYDIKGKESARINNEPSLFNKLYKKALVDSVKGSNAIENIVTSDSKIDTLINKNEKPITHDEKQIVGYKNVLQEIHLNHDLIKLDCVTLKSFHKQMLDLSESQNRGLFKKDPNTIIETVNGKRKIRFIPVLPNEVTESLEQMFLAYEDAYNDYEINKLLLIPCVVLDFLCIHPFDDGNGRISRLLTLLLYYKAGFDIGKYISIEKTINDSKEEYYEALKESSIGWHENKNNYFPFIKYMIQVLYLCYKKLDENIFSLLNKKMTKADRIEYLLLNAYVPISKSFIINELPDISVKTIELTLSKLLNENKIIKIGSYKDAKYYRK